jgi:2-oxo-3-hexenedioate decarboxylase
MVRKSGGGLAREACDIDAIAAEAFEALGTGKQIAPFSARYPGFGIDDAYRVTAAVRERRLKRGERIAGRKIGFTNRTIWAEYNVFAPIWGYVYDETLFALAHSGGRFAIAQLPEPRIEPEIVFGLDRAPAPGMDEAALLSCIEWVAPGFEIVQSIFPGWRFTAADTIAAFGLHGALAVGTRHKVASRSDWQDVVAALEADLFRDGERVDHGRAANVLDSPLSALKHLVELLATDRVNPPLAAGEVITTGTLTRAFPIRPGETWRMEFTIAPFAAEEIRFVSRLAIR